MSDHGMLAGLALRCWREHCWALCAALDHHAKRQHDATLAWLDANAPAVAGLHDELTAYFDRDITQPPLFKKGREFFRRTRKGEPASAM